MKINEDGLALLKKFEGCRLNAYPDPGTGAQPWTIGYGHTGPEVHRGQVITAAEAEALLCKDLARFEAGVSKAVGAAKTTENQFSAMVCLAYNIGLGSFGRSSVLKAHLRGAYQEAADAFLLWDKAAGKVLKGLVRRRQAESELYLTP